MIISFFIQSGNKNGVTSITLFSYDFLQYPDFGIDSG